MKKLLIAILIIMMPVTAWGAFSASAIVEIQAGGSTNNGGVFDPGQTLESVDLACTVCDTAAPVLTSATYTFVAGDVNSWVYIKAGTNWTPGWYKISSVNAGAATVNGTIGAAIQGTAPNLKLNTVAGVATVATQDANFGTFAVDYSQGTAAIDNGTDLASADGDAVPCIVSSASHNFIDAEIGNSIHITEAGDGFTLGRYVITSTDGTSATLDRACGTNGAKAGGDWYLGGAADTNVNTSDSEMFASLVAGNTVYFLGVAGAADDYDISENITGTAGGADTEINMIGYITNRATVPIGTDRPEIDMGAYLFTVTTGYWNVRNVIMHGTAAGVVNLVDYSTLYNSLIYNTSGTADRYALTISTNSILSFCEVYSTNGYALITGTGTKVLNNYIHDSKYCLNPGTNSMTIGNIIDTCSTAGIYKSGATDGLVIYGNTLYGADSATADGITLGSATGSGRAFIVNNIIANWNYGITLVNPNQIYEDYNLFYSNDDNFYNTATVTIGVNDVTADPGFTDAANGDFRVGTNAKAQGWPDSGYYPGLAVGAGYSDVGALQRVEPSGGGGGAWGF